VLIPHLFLFAGMTVNRSADPGCGQRIVKMSTPYLLGIAGKFFNSRQISESRRAVPDSASSVGLAKI
jgi:hypothetical protein